MKKDELLNYFDDLTRLAQSKCTSDADAEDLVSETFLAALAFLNRGGEIAYPKTWLANTLMHKYNSVLRKKYSAPEIVNCDVLVEMSDLSNEIDEIGETDEEAELRREVAYLTRLNREAVIRYYFAGESVSQIAESLGVPEGTVKSRLFAGRGQIRKGLDKMAKNTNDTITNALPARLSVSWSGRDGKNGQPMSLVENDLIAKNILINAYERPLTSVEIARSLGIPTAYLEPIIEKLVNGELMTKTDGDRYYTDCIIFKPEDTLTRFDVQLKFVEEHFDRIWSILADMEKAITGLDFCKALDEKQRIKLGRYAILHALQQFTNSALPKREIPKRKDGGQWVAMTWMYPAGYDLTPLKAIDPYSALGGLRTSDQLYDGKILWLKEFDTTLWDSPDRYSACGHYYHCMSKMLWCIRNGSPLEGNEDLSTAIIESIPQYVELGMLDRGENGELKAGIPILSKGEYNAVDARITEAKKALEAEIGAEYADFLCGTKIELPAHLKGSPNILEAHLYYCSNQCIPMAVVRKAYEKKLHLKDVAYCCPPVVLVYEEA